MSSSRSATWLKHNGTAIVILTAFLFMAMLIVEQARTIENQKNVLRMFFADSLELSAVKMRHALPPKK